MVLTQELTLEDIRTTGLEILLRGLGPVGLIRFLQQYENGRGDYSVERHQWLDRFSIEEIVKEAQAIEKLNSH